MRLAAVSALAAGLCALAATGAPAHDGAKHATEPAATENAGAPAAPFPIPIRPRFALVDHTGQAVTEADFAGRPMAIFFGYANCDSICSVALPALGEALDLVGGAGAEIAPLMITVDPARDTPEALARALPKYHPRLIGLTGSEEALAEARAVFQIEARLVSQTADGAPVYAHGSFIYLVGRDGEVKTLLPPILAAERIAELMRKYLL